MISLKKKINFIDISYKKKKTYTDMKLQSSSTGGLGRKEKFAA